MGWSHLRPPAHNTFLSGLVEQGSGLCLSIVLLFAPLFVLGDHAHAPLRPMGGCVRRWVVGVSGLTWECGNTNVVLLWPIDFAGCAMAANPLHHPSFQIIPQRFRLAAETSARE